MEVVRTEHTLMRRLGESNSVLKRESEKQSLSPLWCPEASKSGTELFGARRGSWPLGRQLLEEP